MPGVLWDYLWWHLGRQGQQQGGGCMALLLVAGDERRSMVLFMACVISLGGIGRPKRSGGLEGGSSV